MKIQIKTLIVSFVSLWIASFFIFRTMNDWGTANNIGGSFGAISALFSGVALALAIYSMVLQQQQAREFEQNTLKAEQRTANLLEQQSRAIGLIEQSLKQQIDAGRIAALTFMVERQEQRVETLRDWGRSTYKDENHYQRGIDAAKQKIMDLSAEIEALGRSAKK